MKTMKVNSKTRGNELNMVLWKKQLKREEALGYNSKNYYIEKNL